MEDWVTVALEEYKTLREESKLAIQNQLSSVQVGTGSIGVLLAAGFGLWDSENLLPIVIFLLFVPAISYIGLFIWIGEVMRMMRAGRYVSFLEKKISAEFEGNPLPLNWECWLRKEESNKKTPQMKFNYIAILILFITTGFSSTGMGIYKVINSEIPPFFALSILLLSLGIFTVLCVQIYLLARKIEENKYQI